MNKESIKVESIEQMLQHLAKCGGAIVSTGSMTCEAIELARQEGRMIVIDSLGYVWYPDLPDLPYYRRQNETVILTRGKTKCNLEQIERNMK